MSKYGDTQGRLEPGGAEGEDCNKGDVGRFLVVGQTGPTHLVPQTGKEVGEGRGSG